MTPRPELLAPVGDLEGLAVVLAAGADAVYLGVGRHHARAHGREGLQPEQLGDVIARCHRRGVRVYLTLNTLVPDEALEEAVTLAAQAQTEGIDAVIVQDLGLAARLRDELPSLTLHASTQMVLTSPESLALAAELGIRRVVLPRELSFAEVEDMVAAAARDGIECEAFVQGALCVACSGLCGLSEAIGGRSANRGACAQPCRLDWTLVDGDREEGRHRLSTRELGLGAWLQRLRAAGIASVKVEGRKRDAQYACLATHFWRARIDGEAADPDLLRLAFLRGDDFSEAFIGALRGPGQLVTSPPGRAGLLLGTMRDCDIAGGWLAIARRPGATGPLVDIERGDTLVVRDATQSDLASAPVGRVEATEAGWRVRGFHPDRLRALPRGAQVFRVAVPRLVERLAAQPYAVLSLELRLERTETGWRLGAQWRDRWGQTGQLAVEAEALAPRPALPDERVRQALAKVDTYPARIARIDVADPVELPISQLNRLRRELLAALFDDGELLAPPRPAATPALARRAPAVGARRRPDRQPPLRLILNWPENPATRGAARPLGADAIREALPELEPQQLLCLQPLAVWAEAQARGEDSFAAQAGLGHGLVIPALAPLDRRAAWLTALEAAAHAPRHLQLQQLHRPLADDGFELSAAPSCNLINRPAVGFAAQLGIASLAYAWELREPAARARFAAACRANGTRLLLPLDGPRAVMTMRHCPIGERRAGCRRCLAAGTEGYTLRSRDRDVPALRVVPQPELDCQSTLYFDEERAIDPDWLAELLAAGNPLDLQIDLVGLDEAAQRALLARWRAPLGALQNAYARSR